MSAPNYCPTHDFDYLGSTCPDCRDDKPSAFLSAEEQERIRLNVRKAARDFIRTTNAVQSMYGPDGTLISPVPTKEA